MSTFLGFIEEIPGISVDCFEADNLFSGAYFLSHCHTDHEKGLNTKLFDHLERNKIELYCSSITKLFLFSKYHIKSNYVRDLKINVPTLIEYDYPSRNPNFVTVTCISAGHCPGSVMFLFEKDNKTILYTGDFRVNPLDLPSFKLLHNYIEDRWYPKQIDKIYLDTTFLSPAFPSFPSRQESLDAIVNITKEWLEKGTKKVVVLECSALYGSEYLFIELSKIFNMKVHVNNEVYTKYRHIFELDKYVTDNPLKTRIHACVNKRHNFILKCRPDIKVAENILFVVPSALKWAGQNTAKVSDWDPVHKQMYNVCYSMHCSYNELKEFVRYFKPNELYPCVIPKNVSINDISSLLTDILHGSNSDEKQKMRFVFTYTSTKPEKKSARPKYFSDDEDGL